MEWRIIQASYSAYPKCGCQMVLLTAAKGAHARTKVWGCSKFLDCRGILAYEEGKGIFGIGMIQEQPMKAEYNRRILISY